MATSHVTYNGSPLIQLSCAPPPPNRQANSICTQQIMTPPPPTIHRLCQFSNNYQDRTSMQCKVALSLGIHHGEHHKPDGGRRGMRQNKHAVIPKPNCKPQPVHACITYSHFWDFSFSGVKLNMQTTGSIFYDGLAQLPDTGITCSQPPAARAHKDERQRENTICDAVPADNSLCEIQQTK